MLGLCLSTYGFSSPADESLGSKCTGAGTLPGDGPYCYGAKIGMLGVTEKLSLKVTRTTGTSDVTEKGLLDLTGSGISPFKCHGLPITKNGQDVQVDQGALSKCLPRGVTLVSATYCSDTDEISVSIKDKNIPVFGSITRNAGRVSCPSTTVTDFPGLFNAWATEYDRAYASGEAATKAFSAFIANHVKIEQHNLKFDQGEASFSMGHTRFSDMTPKEFSAFQGYNATQAAMGLVKLPRHQIVEGEIQPASVDWSTRLGCSTNVKNQESCGSCWAFSAVGAIEAQLCGEELSEQDLVSCDKSDNGCQGGSMESAFGWVHRHGIASESGYRYTASNSYCDTAKENKKVATVDGSTSVNGEDGLKSAVSMRSVSVGVDATCLQSYRGGILDQSGCSGQLDHGVLAVGYGTEGGKEYFKIKNSWGAGWGEAGYFRVIKGKGMLGIGQQGVYPTGVRSVGPSPTPSPSPTPGPGKCTDTPPPSSIGTPDPCEEQKEWGKCSRSWMKGYCCKSCFGCDAKCGK